MVSPIKPLFATVPAKVYSPNKPLFVSEAIEFLDMTTDEIVSLNLDLNLTPQQLKNVRFDISQMNMKSTRFDFIDDVGMSHQMALALLSDWTARVSTGKLLLDIQSAMGRVHSLTSRRSDAGLGEKVVRFLFRSESVNVGPDVSREVQWLQQAYPQRTALMAEISSKIGEASKVKDGLSTSLATCRGLASKGKIYEKMANHVSSRIKSIQLSFVICQQLISQLENLLAELKQIETDIKSLSLNLVPAWDVNRSLQQ